MARRDPDDPGLKRSVRENEQEKEEEQELEKDVQQDQQQIRDAAQDALGNQAVQEMMGVVSAKAGEAGQGADLGERKGTEEMGVDYGGDDDAADAPITMEDLVRSWNPTTTRGQDKEPFREGLGTEELPPVPPELVDALGPLPASSSRDAVFLGAEGVEVDPGPVVRTAVRLASASPLALVVATLAAPAQSPLIDPRVSVVRSRALAWAVLLCEASCELVDEAERTPLRPMVRLLLELSTLRTVLPTLLDRVAAEKTQLPLAVDLTRDALEAPAPPGSGESPSVEQIEHLKAVLHELGPRPSASTLVPELPSGLRTEEEPVDDPLGIDEILRQGHKPDLLGPQYDNLLAAAERLAVLTTRMRVEGSAGIVAVARVLGRSTDTALARRAAQQLDAEAAKVLQLLVEVARAIQTRGVPPPGIRNGLRRAAKSIDLVWTQFCGWLGGVVSAAVPPPPALALPPLGATDALAAALEAGDREAARRILATMAGPDAQLARLLLSTPGPTTVEDGHRVSTLARAARRPALARLADLWVLLAAGAHDRGRQLGLALRVQQETFVAGDDLAFAVVTQVLLDQTAQVRPGRVAAQHLEACRRLAPLGPSAGLALLLRWAPLEADEPS